MVTVRMGKISVFCSYAREDESYRQQLEMHLAPLRDKKVIDDWYDNRIQAGARWNAQIESALANAKLVLFIVTPDLLASRYINEVELPRSLELERAGRCQIVPIVARASEWSDSPLAEFQALPRGARPLESYGDPHAAYREVVTGLTEVCKRIVDWENPYKRAQVGDWTHGEQTTTLADGRSVTVEITVEVVKKTAKQVVALLEGTGAGQQQSQKLKIDLTQPLEDRLAENMRQLGETLPANAEVLTGPSRFEEETLRIGGKRYATVKATREITLAQRGEEHVGTVSTWRCIDVPLDGIVKSTSNIPGVLRQNLVLLDHGHGDARRRKPALARQRAAPLIGPGRWRMQMNMFGASTTFDLVLQANGTLQGTQSLMGFAAPLQGRWASDGDDNTLTLQLVVIMMGMPAGQDLIQMRIVGRDGSLVHGVDAAGRRFVLQQLA